MWSLYDAAGNGDLDLIKSAIEDGSVHVNAIYKDDVSICHIIRHYIEVNYK